MRLSHLHLPRRIPYAHALKLQDALLTRQFQYKSQLKLATARSEPLPPAPNPVLLTFETQPTYTVGRRHLSSNPLSESQIAFLTGQSHAIQNPDHDHGKHREQVHEHDQAHARATFFPSPRGGLLTYHAPGQLTAFLVLDLRVHRLTPRCYIRFLEDTVIKTCAAWGVPNTVVTDDPGVWIAEKHGSGSGSGQATTRKVCAIGVHVSRGVTSHGVGLNVRDQRFNDAETDTATEERYLSWGFGRIVACGLEGKSVTWLQREVDCDSSFAAELSVGGVAGTLARETAAGLGLSRDVEVVDEAEVLGVD